VLAVSARRPEATAARHARCHLVSRSPPSLYHKTCRGEELITLST
jgi:hypothetical protein